jgi:2-polyprenyl-3-methyl-5-hydroxy-6-metoxy-1,4-benzoquinol methylase
MQQNLSDFYEFKYQQEVTDSTLKTISYTRFPLDRYQACYKYFIDNFKGGNILELGSGQGLITKSLLDSNLPIQKYVASDLSDNRLTGLRKNITDNRLQTVNINAENIDPENMEKFDAIIMVALIEHLIDPLKAMKEIRKLLKPNGFIYIDTPNIADYGSRFKLLRGRFPATSSRNEGLTTYDGKAVSLHDEGHLHYFTYRSLSLMLKQYCGFEQIQKVPYPVGYIVLGKQFHTFLAKLWPEMFSFLTIVAK